MEVKRVEEHVRLVGALASEALEERLVVVLLQDRLVLRMGTLLDDLKSPINLFIPSIMIHQHCNVHMCMLIK